MSKQFSVDVGCRKLPNSNQVVCDDIPDPDARRKKFKKDKKSKQDVSPKKSNSGDKKKYPRYTPSASSWMPRYPIGKATRKFLTDDEVERARGIQASKIYEKRGMEALKKHMKEFLPEYKLEKAIN